MEETELEEGKKDDAAFIDPDISLSYIDKKLQNVLGHFQRDFEGGVFAENLGAKYGGYGSFLPTPLSSPVQSCTNTPQGVQNLSTLHSTTNYPSEGAPPDPVVATDLALLPRPPTATSHHGRVFCDQNVLFDAGASTRKDSLQLVVPSAKTFLSKSEATAINSENSSDQRSLKVRIKVGSDKMARKNAAIYSGLGLISPSSSTGNSTEEISGMPTKSPDIPFESPGSILHDMTAIPVPENLLISPLSESLLCIIRKEKVAENKPTLSMEGRQRNSSIFVDVSFSMLEEGELLNGKEIRTLEKSEALEEMMYENGTDFGGHIRLLPEKGEATGMMESKQCLTNDLKLNVLSNSLSDIAHEAQREAKKDVPVKRREKKKDCVGDRFLAPDAMNKKLLGLIHGQHSGTHGQKNEKHSSIERIEQAQLRGSATKFDSREHDRTKSRRVYSISRNDTDVSKHQKGSLALTVDHSGKKASSSATGHEPHQVKVPNGVGKSSFESQKKSKGFQSSHKSSSNLVEENLNSGGLRAMKDKKCAQKNVLKVSNTYNDIPGTEVECQNSEMIGLEIPIGKGSKDHDLSAGKGKDFITIKVSGGQEVPPQTDVLPAAPLEDHWVGCDCCEKWRLLPHGIDLDHLPEKWVCSMSTWLPGRNCCDISEEESTRLVQEMNHYSFLQNQDKLQCCGNTAVYGVVSGNVANYDEENRNLDSETTQSRIKKKNKLRPTADSSTIQASHPAKDAQLHGLKRKRLSERHLPVLETSNFSLERHAAKMNGEDVNEGVQKHKKLKIKRDYDQQGRMTSKNKIQVAPDTDGCRKSESVGDLRGTDFSSSATLPIIADGNHRPRDRLVISVKRQRDSTQVSVKGGSLNSKPSVEHEMHDEKRKLKNWQESQPYIDTLESNGCNLLTSKIREESSERIRRKEKKLKISNTEINESTANKGDDGSFCKRTVTKIILGASKDNSVDRSREKNLQRSKHREKVSSQPNLDDFYQARKDLGSERFIVAATSSSSKVSDPCRRASLQEIKGSPVESVSSSPMRALNQDKLSHARKAISRKLLARESNVVNHRDVEDTPDHDAHQRSGGKFESKHKLTSKIRNNDMIDHYADTVMEQKLGQSYKQASGSRMSMELDFSGSICLENSGKGLSSSKDQQRGGGSHKVKVKASDPLTSQELLPNKMKTVDMDLDDCGPVSLPEVVTDVRRKLLDDSNTKMHNKTKSVGKKGSSRWISDSMGVEKQALSKDHVGTEIEFLDIGSGEGKATLKKDLTKGFLYDISKEKDPIEVEPRDGKAEVNSCHAGKVDQLVLLLLPLSHSMGIKGSDGQAIDSKGDNLSKTLEHPGITVNQNGKNRVPHSSTAKDLGVLSFVKKYASSPIASSALKAAEDSKVYADQIKIFGFDYECNEAYFDTALKFLYSASLLEAHSNDDNKLKALDHVHIYNTAAKLCETCAHGYEKQKEMASVALAYKCTEVAYMRVVYCKNSIANRDRYDLQASLQMITQGESPSSSASDVDNFNNQATMDKAMLSKTIAHSGNSVSIGQNHANFLRLLDFTNDVNAAMEASRKTRSACTAATAILQEAQNKESISLVKRVTELSFQDVKQLVCLVQHAREAINGQCFNGSSRE